VVSGFAKGVDRAAHEGAIDGGGETIAVLAEGFQGFRMAPELGSALEEGNLLVVSPFEHAMGWTVYRAMHRNKWIVGLSIALVCISPGSKGGTFEAGVECLRRKKRLWVMDDAATDGHPSDGTNLLVRKGGMRVDSVGDVIQSLAAAQSLIECRDEARRAQMPLSLS